MIISVEILSGGRSTTTITYPDWFTAQTFPETFYENTPELQIVKTSDPTGYLLDPMDLLSSKPWAKVDTRSEIRKGAKKILILADPACENYSRALNVERRLHAARAAGFEVYIFEKDELKKTDGKIIPIDYKVDLKQATFENISKLAFKEYQIPAHKIYILGYFETNMLIGQDELKLRDFNADTDNLEKFNEFVTHLAKEPNGRHKLKKIHFGVFVDFLKTPEILMANQFNFLEEIGVTGKKNEINFLNKLIEFSKNLKILNLPHFEDVSELLNGLDQGVLSQLQAIDLSYTKVTAQDLKKLFRLSPNLRAIKLRDCKYISGLFDGVSKGVLSQLQTIDLSFTNVTVQDLKQFFRLSPNLISMELIALGNISGLFDGLSERGLFQLQTIDLTYTDVEVQDLKQLFRLASNLRVIKLGDCKNLSGLFDWLSERDLFQLEKINLTETGVKVQDLKQLFRFSTNLTGIELSLCKYISGLFEGLSEGALSQLESIELSETDVTVQDLRQLFRLAPNLRGLRLSSCVKISGLFEGLSEGALSQLESIDLSDTDITVQDLRQLFRLAPNLRVLNLSQCKHISGLFDELSEGALSQLQEIISNETDLSVKDLKKLLAVAPNLIEEFCGYVRNDCNESNNLINHRFLKLIPCNLDGKDYYKLKGNDYSFKETQRTVLNLSSNETNVVLPFVRYFEGVSPEKYRLNVWQPDLASKTISKTFDPLTNGWEELLPAENPLNPLYQELNAEGSSVYSGKVHVDTSIMNKKALEQPFIRLPSLSATEKIKTIAIVDSESKIIKKDIKLVYNPKARFYGVYLPPGIKEYYTISFEVVASLSEELSDQWKAFAQFYRNFMPKNLMIPTFSTLKEAANFYQTHQTGRCELRALAAYTYLLSSNQGYNTENLRVICNDVHAYLEVKYNGIWQKIELGGHSAKLNELKPEAPKRKPKKQEEEEPLEMRVSTINLDKDNLAKNEETDCLYLISNVSVLKTLYERYVTQYEAENIFIVNEVSKISLSGHSINRWGKILSDGSSLKRFLESHSSQECLIVVDMRLMEDEEIPQLNDLLDRNIEGRRLPGNIKISLIDSIKRSYYGPDFRRRVSHHIRVNAVEKPLLLDSPKTDKTRKRKEIGLNTIEIDLFGSPFFERLLLGFWGLEKNNVADVNATALKLMWKKGSLFQAIENAEGKSMEIVFKNPPVADLKFQTFMVALESIRRLSWANETLTIPQNITFYQANGYDWLSLSQNVTIEPLSEKDISAETSTLYPLSNSNILSFINEPAYFFAKETQCLEPQASYLSVASKKQDKAIRVVCVPGLSESTLAQFLTEAYKRNIKVSFVTPDVKRIPAKSVLHLLEKAKKISAEGVVCAKNVRWELHEDLYGGIVGYRNDKSFQGIFFNLSSLSASDLGHFPEFSRTDIETFLQTSTLSFEAPFSDIAERLRQGKTIVLAGDIPPTLYEALTQLSLGYIDGERFKGQLIILTTPKEQALVEDLTGLKLPILNRGTDAAKKRRETLGSELRFEEFLEFDYTPLTDNKNISDEARAQEFDTRRLEQVIEGFKKSPWVMLEGKTGIGKSHFMQNLLSEKVIACDSLEEWFLKTSEDNRPIVLIVDEANFNSQLNNRGDNFLERFLGLENNPPGFLWQGKYRLLTQQHKVLFAFNPSTYGQGRKSGGILVEHNIPVQFNPLPDFYLRARVITPLLNVVLGDKASIVNPILSSPIESMYSWLTEHAKDEVLITPREIKAMINLIVMRINQGGITHKEIISEIAKEVAYDIGRQTIIDNKTLLSEFDSAFQVPTRVMSINLFNGAQQCMPYQQPVYNFIQTMLAIKDTLLSPQNPDLGLGGIILEGPSGIGKTYFINQVSTQYQSKANKEVYSISPSTPYTEKVKILEQAFKKGALVVAEEFNTSLWPNKLLNSYLMGVDENGKPSSHPGFMLIVTQNPPYFAYRSEEDPAIRRRVIKFSLDWPKINLDKNNQNGQPITLAFEHKRKSVLHTDTFENNERPKKKHSSDIVI